MTPPVPPLDQSNPSTGAIKGAWAAPTVEELDVSETEAAFGGVGVDFGLYQS